MIVMPGSFKTHDDYRLYLEEKFNHIESESNLRQSGINAQFKQVNETLSKIEKHLERQNSNIFRLQKESEERKQAVEDFKKLESKIKWCTKHWLGIILITMVVIWCILFLYEVGLFQQLFQLIFNKVV